MKYCISCGKEMDIQNAFCTDCGTPQVEEHEEFAIKEGMSKRKKITLWSITALVVVLAASHFIVMSILDPMKDIKAMDQAILSGNADDFFDYVELDQSALIHEEEFLEFIRVSGWETMRTQLTNVVSQKAETVFSSPIYDAYGNEMFVVEKVDVIPMLYHTYEIKAIPSPLMITSNIDNVTVELEKQTLNVEKADVKSEFSLLYPGTYVIKSESINEFGEFRQSKDVEVSSLGNQPIEVNINFSERRYGFSTNIPEALLFVNGKSTGKTLGEYEALGPFPEDQTVEMFAQWTNDAGEKVNSETITQEDYSIISGLSFYFEEEMDTPVAENAEDLNGKQAREEFVLNFRKAYENALNSIDYSMISDYLLSGSQAHQDLSKYIGDLKDEGYRYDFLENTVLSNEALSDHEFLVTTNEKFVFTNHLGEKTHYDRNKEYYVIQNSDGLKIKNIEINNTVRSGT